MSRKTQSRRAIVVVAVVLVLVAVAMPTARIIGCSMVPGSGAATSWRGSDLLGFYADCGAELSVAAALVTGLPSGAGLLAVAGAAMMIAAAVMESTKPRFVVIRAYSSDPPPERDDPLGSRLSI